MRLRRRRLLALSVVLASAPGTALGEPPAFAVATLRPCAGEDAAFASVRAALEVELATQHIALLAAAPETAAAGDGVRLEVLCPADFDSLVLRAAFRDRQLVRALSVGNLDARVRPRTVALSLAELTASLLGAPRESAEEAPTSSEPAAAPEATAAAEAPPAAPEPAPPPKVLPKREERKARTTATAPPRAHDDEPLDARSASIGTGRSQLAFGPEARWFIAGTTVWGGRLEAAFGPVLVGGSVLGGTETAPAGSVLGAIAQATLGLRLHERSSRERLVRWGPRIGFGVVHAEGIPTDDAGGGDVLTSYLDVAVSALGQISVSRVVRVGASLEVGYAHGVIVLSDDLPAAHFGGTFAGAGLHLAIDVAPGPADVARPRVSP